MGEGGVGGLAESMHAVSLTGEGGSSLIEVRV